MAGERAGAGTVPQPETSDRPEVPEDAAPAAGSAAVTRLTLTRFRNFPFLRLEVPPQTVVLTGANGAGKTNLLEAVSLLAPGRGLRNARLGEITTRQPPAFPAENALVAGPEAGLSTGLADDREALPQPWAVAATVRTGAGGVEIGTGGDPHAGESSGRRRVRIEGRNARSQTELAQHLTLVWLTPAMDRLFQEGAALRRRFFDRLVFGFEAGHAARLTGYERAQRERTRLLREGAPDRTWLSALENDMAIHGVALAATRRQVVARLNGAAAALPGAFPVPVLTVAGEPEPALAGMGIEDGAELLRRRLWDNRRRDGEAGTATFGPHRSDFQVHDATRGEPAGHCSTGQQKALLIALVLADAALLKAERGAPPVLLLDEVAAHLDSERRQALCRLLQGLGAQAWLSGTDAVLFAPFRERATHVEVAGGRVIAVSGVPGAGCS